MNDIISKPQLEVALPTGNWGASEQISQGDIIIPKIYLMQALSDLVEAERAKAGEWVDSIEETILAGRDDALEVIIFDSFKRWQIFSVADGKQTFAYSEDYTEDNCNAPYVDTDDEGKPIHRHLQYNFYCLLPSAIDETPYVLSLSKTATNAAKRINTLFAKLSRINRPSASIVLSLTAEKESNDKGTWYGIGVSKERDTTAQELAVAYDWYVQVRNNAAIKVQDDENIPF